VKRGAEQRDFARLLTRVQPATAVTAATTVVKKAPR
jgi:hypothetical protein